MQLDKSNQLMQQISVTAPLKKKKDYDIMDESDNEITDRRQATINMKGNKFSKGHGLTILDSRFERSQNKSPVSLDSTP